MVCSFKRQIPRIILTIRHRRFSGDESFSSSSGKSSGNDAGISLGVVIEGKKSADRLHSSRL